jgi:hypothetical protein
LSKGNIPSSNKTSRMSSLNKLVKFCEFIISAKFQQKFWLRNKLSRMI